MAWMRPWDAPLAACRARALRSWSGPTNCESAVEQGPLGIMQSHVSLLNDEDAPELDHEV